MYEAMRGDLAARLAGIRAQGAEKLELVMTSAQGVHVSVDGRGEILNLCANNYLGLANHPKIVAAAHEALDRWGYGMASVRFICGTQELHRDLEDRLTEFLGTDATILFGSCFDANGSLFEALLDENDAVISDELNHASIIDGIRLCKARRLRYANGDMDELEARLKASADSRYRLIATDGVFSMDGHVAALDQICDLAERYDALVMVDDSHAVGVVGSGGRGTHELHDVVDRVDIITGTLGKAMGGGSGGYISGRAEIVAMLRQRARSYLFSNSVPPPVAAASSCALDLIAQSPELRDQLADNTRFFRGRMTEEGFDIIPGDHPIVPVMIGDEAQATQLATALVDQGIYAVGFTFPVVPKGTARIRTQMSSAHSNADLEHAARAFCAARDVVA